MKILYGNKKIHPKNIARVTQIELDAELQNYDMKIESHLQRSKIICAVTAYYISNRYIRLENKTKRTLKFHHNNCHPLSYIVLRLKPIKATPVLRKLNFRRS